MFRRRSRGVLLGALAIAGLLTGYLLVSAARSGGEVSGAAEGGESGSESPSTSPALPELPPQPGRRGSSISVVGGMSPEEMVRLGISSGEAKPAAEAASPEALQPRREEPLNGPPASSIFPPAVQQAAVRYTCLCGCPHVLVDCPCNEQPIGAVTMLTYLQKLMDRGLAGADLDAAMVERYGERVLAPASERP